jgi:F-type H+-transporting ATPase subunit alpha
LILHRQTLKEAIEAKGEVFGLVLNLEEESVRVIILGDAGFVREGMTVISTARCSLSRWRGALGRVVSPLGEPLDGLGAIKANKAQPDRARGVRRDGPPVG